jgi:hypothetical protein
MTSNSGGGGGLKPRPKVSAGDIAIMRELAGAMLTYSRRCEGRLGLDLAAWSARISLRATSLDQEGQQGRQRARGAPAPR